MPAKKSPLRTRRPPHLAPDLMRRLQKICDDAGQRLTPSRINAYAELVAQDRPLSAYELLALLEKREGRKLAPLTVYRLLDFLTEVGLVHRLASAQVFLACAHPDHPHQGLYLVCSSCGKADELESNTLSQLLGKAAKSRGFQSQKQIVEVQGLCNDCGDGT